MLVANIPRRKIYETMLDFEDGLIEMNILNLSQNNFDKFSEKFNKEGFPLIKSSYFKIKALFCLFLENRMFEDEKDFEKNLEYYMKNKQEVHKTLKKNKTILNDFIKVCEDVEKEFEKIEKVNTFEESKKLFELLDKFNHFIPELLTVRRDRIN